MASKDVSHWDISSNDIAKDIYNKALEFRSSLWDKKFKNVDNRTDYIFEAVVSGFNLEYNNDLAGRRERVLDALYTHIYAGLT